MAKSKNKLLATPAASIPPTIMSPSIPSPNANSNFTATQAPSTPLSIKQQSPQNTNVNNKESSSVSNNIQDNIESTKNSIDLSPKSTFSSSCATINSANNNNSNSINDNISTDNLLINDDIIGHEIPTPECIPKKHSNIQSKLVTSTSTTSTTTTATSTAN